jgi:hypothetical protein
LESLTLIFCEDGKSVCIVLLGVMLFFVITGSVDYFAWCNILSVSQKSSLSTDHSTVKFIVSIQVASIMRTLSNAVDMFVAYK